MIRDRLAEPGSVVVVQDLIYDLHESIQIPRSDDLAALNTATNGRILAGEIEYLVRDAIRTMQSDGELMVTSAGGGHGAIHGAALAEHPGWQGNHWGAQLPGAIAPSVRLQARHNGQWQDTPGTTWANVDRLVGQSWHAYTIGLDVAAAVCARVAVEEAVSSALGNLGDPRPDFRAARRETHLFAHLRVHDAFTPLDRNATIAAITAVRDRGNQAAHTGVIDHELLQDALLRLLPQALTSLSRAVAAQ